MSCRQSVLARARRVTSRAQIAPTCQGKPSAIIPLTSGAVGMSPEAERPRSSTITSISDHPSAVSRLLGVLQRAALVIVQYLMGRSLTHAKNRLALHRMRPDLVRVHDRPPSPAKLPSQHSCVQTREGRPRFRRHLRPCRRADGAVRQAAPEQVHLLLRARLLIVSVSAPDIRLPCHESLADSGRERLWMH